MHSLLITGAASGIGKELVARALKRGDRVFATQRSDRGLEEFAASPNFTAIRMDVAQTDSVAKGFEEIDRHLAGVPLNGVINSAAVAPLGALELTPMSVFENTLNTNALGTLRVMQNAIPRLRGHDGRLILITSLWGRVSGPMLSAYASSKHAIEAMADAARRETHGQGIRITVVEPGVIRTRMLNNQLEEAKALADAVPESHRAVYGELYRKYAGLLAKGAGQGISVEDCAQQIENVLRASAPKARYRIGKDSKAVCTMARVLSDSQLDGVFRMMMK